MPHTTRKNYKSKLLDQDRTIQTESLEQVSTADKAYHILEKEAIGKRQLHELIAEVGEMAIDVVRKADSHSVVGALKFEKCEQVNDDRLKYFDATTILDRAFDVMMMAEERIEVLAYTLHESIKAREMVSARLNGLLGKVDEGAQLQHELYDVGKSPSETEIAEFEEAETKGIKYVRTFADRNMQTKPTSDPVDSGMEDEPEEKPAPKQNGQKSQPKKMK